MMKCVHNERKIMYRYICKFFLYRIIIAIEQQSTSEGKKILKQWMHEWKKI